MKKKFVRTCFGHYGEKEDKDCGEDCNNCPEMIERKKIIFCPKKKAYPCDILCEDVDLCKSCYFGWWDKNRNKKCSLKEEIKKFMEKNNLRWKTNQKTRQR
jgi:hypothetical protein